MLDRTHSAAQGASPSAQSRGVWAFFSSFFHVLQSAIDSIYTYCVALTISMVKFAKFGLKNRVYHNLVMIIKNACLFF